MITLTLELTKLADVFPEVSSLASSDLGDLRHLTTLSHTSASAVLRAIANNMDGDGKLDSQEFVGAVLQEPIMLQCFMQTLPVTPPECNDIMDKIMAMESNDVSYDIMKVNLLMKLRGIGARTVEYVTASAAAQQRRADLAQTQRMRVLLVALASILLKRVQAHV